MFTQPKLDAYRKMWRIEKAESAEPFGSGPAASRHQRSRSPTVPVATMTWAKFIDRVREDRYNRQHEENGSELWNMRLT